MSVGRINDIIEKYEESYNKVVDKLEELKDLNEEDDVIDYSEGINQLVEIRDSMKEELEKLENDRKRMRINRRYKKNMSFEALLKLVERILNISFVVGYEGEEENNLKAVRTLVKDTATLDNEKKNIIKLLTEMYNEKSLDSEPYKAMKKAVIKYYDLLLDGKLDDKDKENVLPIKDVVEQMEKLREQSGYDDMDEKEQRKFDEKLRRKYVLNGKENDES